MVPGHVYGQGSKGVAMETGSWMSNSIHQENIPVEFREKYEKESPYRYNKQLQNFKYLKYSYLLKSFWKLLSSGQMKRLLILFSMTAKSEMQSW